MSNRSHSFRWVVAGWGALLLVLPSFAAQARVSPVPPVAGANPPVAVSSFERYQIILARMPFGDEAAAAAAAAAAAQAAAAGHQQADSFTKNLKMCAITRNRFTEKIQVGLLDTVTKKTYFLYEGDKEDGIELISANYDEEKALLKKGMEEAWMDMNDVKTVVAAAPTVVPAPSFSGRRRGAPPPAPPPKPIYTGAALEKHLKEYQMELIRAGGEKGPPLPMELTPEMDEQLVKEGVLPPTE